MAFLGVSDESIQVTKILNEKQRTQNVRDENGRRREKEAISQIIK